MAEVVYSDRAFAANQENRSRKLLTIVLYLVAVLTGSGALGFCFLFQGASTGVAIAFDSTISLLSIAALVWRKRIPIRTLAHLTLIVIFATIWFIQLKVEGLSYTRTSSCSLWFAVLGVVAVLILYRESRIILTGYLVLFFVSFAFCASGAMESSPVIALANKESVLAANITFVSVFISIMLLTLSWDKEVRDAESNLLFANNRMEDLIVNMLPRSISDRLRREGKTFADGISECSVMFVDIVGFTKMSSELHPNDLVKFLDEIFSEFDELTTVAGLEKIKTIGDSYMVAAGIPDPRPDHAHALVRLAMDMQATIRRFGLHIRCGINSGSVVAGVIGKKKFIYDLWGDTVNVASRMESQGVTDEIQVTESTANLIKDQFALAQRDVIEIKGKGKMAVYLVAGFMLRSKPVDLEDLPPQGLEILAKA